MLVPREREREREEGVEDVSFCVDGACRWYAYVYVSVCMCVSVCRTAHLCSWLILEYILCKKLRNAKHVTVLTK
jgi:hypothetical protein